MGGGTAISELGRFGKTSRYRALGGFTLWGCSLLLKSR